VTIKIFNVTGQEVATLVNEKLLAGYHEFMWNASNMSTGTYFAQMLAGERFRSVIKLMYVR
jgi:hypothetical protein